MQVWFKNITQLPIHWNSVIYFTTKINVVGIVVIFNQYDKSINVIRTYELWVMTYLIPTYTPLMLLVFVFLFYEFFSINWWSLNKK